MAAYSVEGEVAHSITSGVRTHNRTQNENGLHTLIHADDRATLKWWKFLDSLSASSRGSGHGKQWCDRTQLSTNPQNMAKVPDMNKGI